MPIYRARAARTGRQIYDTGPEFRDASEVFAPASLATWVGSPICVGHRAPNMLNVSQIAVGYVASVEREDAGDVSYVLATLVIESDDVARRIDRGELSECSAGYFADMCGDRQTNIRVFELALGPRDWARCGSACSIRR